MVLVREEETKHEGTCRLKGSLKNASALKKDMGKLEISNHTSQKLKRKKTLLYIWSKMPKLPTAEVGGMSKTRQNEKPSTNQRFRSDIS